MKIKKYKKALKIKRAMFLIAAAVSFLMAVLLASANEAPIVNLISPDNNSLVNNLSVNFIFNFTDDNATASCSLVVDNSLISSGSFDNNTNSIFAVNLSGGDKSWHISCSDNEFIVNSSARTLRVDGAAPNSTLNTKSFSTKDRTPEISFSASDNIDSLVDIIIYVNNLANKTSVATSGSTIALELGEFADGLYSVKVEAADDAGNRKNSSEISVIVDNILPAFSLESPQNNSVLANSNAAFVFNASDSLDDFLNYTIFYNGAFKSNGSVNSSVKSTVNIVTSDGTYNWQIKLADDAGNEFYSKNYSFSVDSSSLQITSFSPAGGAALSQRNIDLAVNTNKAAECRYSNVNTGFDNMTNPLVGTGTSHSISLTLDADGSYTYYSACRNDLGQISSTAAISFTITIPQAVQNQTQNQTAQQPVQAEQPVQADLQQPQQAGQALQEATVPQAQAIEQAAPSNIKLELDKENKITVSVNSRMDFELRNESHKIDVAEIGEDYVVFVISSEPIRVRVREGSTKKVDVDNDWDYDIELSVDEVKNSNAKILVKQIAEDYEVTQEFVLTLSNKFDFTIKDVLYSASLKGLGFDSATIGIIPINESFDLELNETRNIDLDDDGTDDISFEVLGIGDLEAKLLFKKLVLKKERIRIISLLPWMIAGIAVLAAVGLFFYYRRPPLERWKPEHRPHE